VRCRAGTGGVLVLDTADGHTVSLASDWARFIELAPTEVPFRYRALTAPPGVRPRAASRWAW
jgi:hypothetical protein